MMAPSLSVMMAQGQSREEEVNLQAARMDPALPALMAVNLSVLRDVLAEVMTLTLLQGLTLSTKSSFD